MPEVVAALREAGIFHMLLPSLGGGAADIVAFNEVILTVAAADASTAWCLGQQIASTQAAGYLDPKIAREIFGPPRSEEYYASEWSLWRSGAPMVDDRRVRYQGTAAASPMSWHGRN